MIKLTITEKGGEPRALTFDQDNVAIGRVQGNDLVLPKGNISKRHSKLTLADGRIVVSDVKSTNGTYVNGRKISEPTPVRAGDKIFIGDFLIVIDPGSAAAETSSTGGRRAPPPPPPPPPRPGLIARALAPAEAGEMNDTTGGFGDFADRPISTGRGRPPAPPPPPPKRTIVTTALEDDSVDIGVDVAPPSPAEIAADAGADPLAELANDDEEPSAAADGAAGESMPSADAGSDVFGSEAAADEDAGRPGGSFPASSAANPSPAESSSAQSGDDNDLPAESAAAVASAPEGLPTGLATLDVVFADPTVTSILIGPGDHMQIERGGSSEPPTPIGDANVVAETVWQIANTAVPPPPADNPVVDVRLSDGTRVTAIFPPITAGAVVAVIRKNTVPELTLSQVAGSSDVEKILVAAVESRRNLILSGDGPALAALAGAIAGAFPPNSRIVTIGTGTKPHPGWTELAPGVDPGALVRAAVAFRADHLLCAAAGGGELPELLLAAARGQEGVIASVPARSASEALERLRAFSVGALGPSGFPAFVASTIDLIVLAGTTAGGTVRVLEIAEPIAEGDTLVPTFVARRPGHDRAAPTLEVAGVSARLAGSIASFGDGLPAHLVRH